MSAALRVLVLDRDESGRTATRSLLEHSGLDLDIRTEGDTGRAVEALRNERFDCFVVAYDGVELDRHDVVRSLWSCSSSCPMVVLTSQQDEERGVELMKAGAADCLRKESLTPDQLAQSLRHAVAISRADELRQQLLAREKAARAEAEAANLARDEFLATLSHELRTPLNAILGWSRLIAGGALDEATLKHAGEIIARNARTQAQLVEDLLDLSRITTGKLKLTVRSVRLAQVIAAAVEAVNAAAQAKEIDIAVDLSAAPPLVACDATRLQQIVWNLLSNAVKFTPNRGRIDVSAWQEDDCVVISVSDSGIGIQPEFLPHVFERFRQQDGATTRAHGGVGLGLAIVKHLAELHGGRVLADSRGTGGGATFTVSLPLATAECAESDVPDKPAASLAFPSPRLEGLKVLLMDSDPDGRALETLVLEDAGAEVTAVTTPDAAIEAAAKSAPQVVLAEVGEDDGLLLIKRLRELSGLSAQVPAAALLGFGSADERTRALLAGFQTCVPKPVDSGELVAVVATLANRATAPGRPTPAR